MAKKQARAEEEKETPPQQTQQVNALVSELGTITFTEGVLSAIVHQAVSGIEGLGEVKGKLTDIVSIFGGRQKGIHIDLKEDGLKVTMNVAVRYGKPIHEVARQIQRRIKEELERMTGLKVRGVDIFVQDVQTAEERPQAKEISEEE